MALRAETAFKSDTQPGFRRASALGQISRGSSGPLASLTNPLGLSFRAFGPTRSVDGHREGSWR